jgi:hypothetical protein
MAKPADSEIGKPVHEINVCRGTWIEEWRFFPAGWAPALLAPEVRARRKPLFRCNHPGAGLPWIQPARAEMTFLLPTVAVVLAPVRKARVRPDYSHRITWIGSIRVARRDGM